MGSCTTLNGHLPVFVHEKSALATFRLFSTQLVINGNATQAKISRAFWVPLVTVKRYAKLFREGGAASFSAFSGDCHNVVSRLQKGTSPECILFL
jgi:hypothetical protein